MLKCTCEGWEKGAASILSAQHLAFTHGIEYAGDTFRFCPWCGVALAVEEEPLHKVEDVSGSVAIQAFLPAWFCLLIWSVITL